MTHRNFTSKIELLGELEQARIGYSRAKSLYNQAMVAIEDVLEARTYLRGLEAMI